MLCNDGGQACWRLGGGMSGFAICGVDRSRGEIYCVFDKRHLPYMRIVPFFDDILFPAPPAFKRCYCHFGIASDCAFFHCCWAAET